MAAPPTVIPVPSSNPANAAVSPAEFFSSAVISSAIIRPALRVTVSKRLYRGGIDLPKSNKVRVIALTPPARDALLSLPEREGPVFLSKSGGRLCAALLSSYWNQVQASAGLRFDFYLSTSIAASTTSRSCSACRTM